MQPDMFDFPVEIKKLNWPFSSNFNENEIQKLLDEFIGASIPPEQEKVFEFYEFARTDIGLSHSATVLYVPNKGYFSVKSIAYSPSIVLSLKKPPVDLANYYRMRTQHLIHSLGEHFPETGILESKSEEFLIIFQKFLFYPICQFSTAQQISQLIEILWLAARARILLDYNQNHWLSSQLDFLYYVDIDYIGQSYFDYQKCILDNLNQSLAFITQENVTLLPQALTIFSESGDPQTEFIKDFKKVLKKLIGSWGDEKQLSEAHKLKLDVFKNILRT
ncbi:MAG: hypothetical protein ACFFDT_39430 [Candidatus Hodarchaeota archaeon]